MKIQTRTYFFLFLFMLATSFFIACSSGNKEQKQEGTSIETQVAKPIVVGTETKLLLNDLKKIGDYVNGRNFPSLIKASSVYEELNNNLLLLDIRSESDYKNGHIEGAINKSFSNLLTYFEQEIKPFEYTRIVLISSDGQMASYTTSLLRLKGYGNVYALRWGMSGWNKQFAQEGWLAACSSDFQEQLETKVNNKPIAIGLPELNTGKSTGEEIGAIRFEQLFSESLEDATINAGEVFANPTAYYVINYDRKDKYQSGHVPGAVRYKPGATLSFVNEMATIPSDKIVVVYCGTGHNSGFVTAYLRLFGYNAKTLVYGNNSFMHNKMINERETLSWLPFTEADSYDYAFVK